MMYKKTVAVCPPVSFVYECALDGNERAVIKNIISFFIIVKSVMEYSMQDVHLTKIVPSLLHFYDVMHICKM